MKLRSSAFQKRANKKSWPKVGRDGRSQSQECAHGRVLRHGLGMLAKGRQQAGEGRKPRSWGAGSSSKYQDYVWDCVGGCDHWLLSLRPETRTRMYALYPEALLVCDGNEVDAEPKQRVYKAQLAESRISGVPRQFLFARPSPEPLLASRTLHPHILTSSKKAGRKQAMRDVNCQRMRGLLSTGPFLQLALHCCQARPFASARGLLASANPVLGGAPLQRSPRSTARFFVFSSVRADVLGVLLALGTPR